MCTHTHRDAHTHTHTHTLTHTHTHTCTHSTLVLLLTLFPQTSADEQRPTRAACQVPSHSGRRQLCCWAHQRSRQGFPGCHWAQSSGELCPTEAWFMLSYNTGGRRLHPGNYISWKPMMKGKPRVELYNNLGCVTFRKDYSIFAVKDFSKNWKTEAHSG